MGSLTHGVTLQGKSYEATIEIWADGLRMTLQEPYFPECTLRVRRGEGGEGVCDETIRPASSPGPPSSVPSRSFP